MKTTADRTRQVIADVVGCSIGHVTDEKHRIADLGFDSLDDILVLMKLEDEFGIEIADEEGEQCDTVAQIAALVEAKMGVKS